MNVPTISGKDRSEAMSIEISDHQLSITSALQVAI